MTDTYLVDTKRLLHRFSRSTYTFLEIDRYLFANLVNEFLSKLVRIQFVALTRVYMFSLLSVLKDVYVRVCTLIL